MRIGGWFVVPLYEGSVMRDGGESFSMIPRTEWAKWIAPDSRNRVPFGVCAFLVQGFGQNVLIDAGYGTKLDDEDVVRMAFSRQADVLSRLADVGVAPEDVNAVVCTHLHRSAAGGLTRLNQAGAVEPTFRNARVIVQSSEWERAIHANLRTRTLYDKEDFEPLLWHQRMEILEGDTEIFSGMHLRVTGGHTLGHQIVVLESEGEGAIFWGDLVPSTHHLRLDVISSTDLYPVQTMEMKAEWLAAAAQRSWVSFLHKDSRYAAVLVSGNVRAPAGVAIEPLLKHPDAAAAESAD